MRKILLVEDEAIIALHQSSVLRRFGYETMTAISGEQAVEVAAAEPTLDLILMDIDLGPGIDGTEAARRILSQRKVPIVFLTSHSEREMVEKVKGITRYGYVIKNSGDFVLQSSIEMAFELFDAHEKLQDEKNRLRTLLTTIPDLVWLKDKEGVYLTCNWMFERFFGAKEAEIVGKTDFDFVAPDLAAFFREHDRLAMEAGKPTRNEEWITFADDGRRALLETIKTPLKDNQGNLIGILGIARDITDRKKAEESLERSKEALKESEGRVQAKLDTILSPEGDVGTLDLKDIIDAEYLQRLMNDFYTLTNMGIGIIDTKGKILVATGWQDICTRFHRLSPDACRHCVESDLELTAGIPPGTFKEYRCKNSMWDIATPIYIGGKHLGNIFLGQFFYTDDVVDYDTFREQARKFGFDETDYLRALDQVPRWTRDRVQATMRFYTDFAGIIGNLSYANILLARSLNERERLLDGIKKSEERFRVIANYTVGWESWFAPDGRYLWVNPGVKEITGYSAEEVLAMPDFIDVIIAKEDRERVREAFRTAGPTSRREDFEFLYLRRSGEKRWLSASWKAIIDQSDIFVGFRVTGHDITARKIDEEKLARSVEEKEILLRELKHRVKNSLTIVSSLLSLNKDLISDEDASRVFLEAISRVKSVSAIYEQLNVSESLDSIDIDVYIGNLVEMIGDTYTVDARLLRFVENVERIPIALKSAVPIGLILNELITNSIKYAYGPEKPGEIRIDLTKSEGQGVLRVSDDGPGLPEGLDPELAESLGLRIVGMLAKQIGGKLRFEGPPGAAAVITFPL